MPSPERTCLSRRSVLTSSVGLSGLLAGCGGLAPADRTSDASGPAILTVHTGQYAHPVVSRLAGIWNLNRAPARDWDRAVMTDVAIETDAHVADYFCEPVGIEPTGQRSRPPFRLAVAEQSASDITTDLAADRIDLAEFRLAADEDPPVDPDRVIEHAVATTGHVFVVSAEVYEAGVTELALDQVRDIYRAEITNWATVGGPDREIYSVGGIETQGTARPVERRFLRDVGETVDDRYSLRRRPEVIADRPDAFGDLPVGYPRAHAGIAAPDVVVDGRARGIRDPAYPLTWRALLNTWDGTDDRERAVLDALRSPLGQRLFVAARGNRFETLSAPQPTRRPTRSSDGPFVTGK